MTFRLAIHSLTRIPKVICYTEHTVHLYLEKSMKKTYMARRARLADEIGEGAIAFILGAVLKKRNSDVDYPFRQESDFLYLTGFTEPNALLIIEGGLAGRQILLLPPKDRARELWDGERLGVRKAVSNLGVTHALPNTPSGYSKCADMLRREYKRTFYQVHAPITPTAEQLATRLFPLTFMNPDIAKEDVCRIIAEHRLFKDGYERTTMARAGQISAEAHNAILGIVQPGMYEYELEAELGLNFRRNGGDALHAYPMIVAGGKNACTLHYIKNSAIIKDRDLVLIDAGCEYRGYASDITRTFPANGRFTEAQRTLYDIVLSAQKAAIAKVCVGTHFHEIHDTTSLVIAEGLLRLGFINAKNPEDAVAQRLHHPYFPHGTSHWLGLDVHDVGGYDTASSERKHMRALEQNMVLTVEPGLYVRPSKDIPREYWSIGIRIEDDVLVTDAGPEVLSGLAIKEPDEIEAVMSQRS